MSTRQILEELAQYTRIQPDKLKNLKEKNLEIVGHTGRFVPEELINACGAVP
jgi:benzoyl-CoA reductase/2-hydroxyglutaryl-CoA dehydratase subunit BcrC/BadD/HgdB